MANCETIQIEVGYEDDGNILFVSIDKEQVNLVRKALTYLYKQEQEEKAKARAATSTCRNCKFSEPRLCRNGTLSCTKRIVHKFYKKVVRPSESCDLFERKEDKE